MANEGSTKLTYSELEAENLRVLGLLQRQWELAESYTKHPKSLATAATLARCILATIPQSSSLVSQGAESADIGKLDTADKSGKVNRVEEMASRKSKPGYENAYWCCAADFGKHEVDCPNSVEPSPKTGSAETGGEKAAPHYDALLKLIQFHNQQEVGVPVEEARWGEAIRNGRVALGMEAEID